MSPPLQRRLLQRLQREDGAGGICSLEAAAALGLEHQALVGAIKSLQALGDLIDAELRSSRHWELTPEGQEVIQEGSHEVRVFNSIPPEGLPQSELMKLTSNKVGFSKAMSNKWIRLDKAAEGGPRVFRAVSANVQDSVREKLELVRQRGAESLEEKDRNELKKRKLLAEATLKSYWIKKGKSFSTTVSKQETDLTPEMISSGSWRDLKFKPYNFEALGIMPESGHLHPLLKVRTQFRQIFLEMGFTEMPTNNYIESAFWNFDALFQPQQHPARDQHDTFFLSDPAEATEFPMDYLQKVKKIHSHGGYGSQGYKYPWKIEEARKNLLRTHTTAVSARMLYQLARQGRRPVPAVRGLLPPGVDSAARSLTALSLSPAGITQLRFKPAYNPYTEPSMEVFSYHQGLGKWVEVGNSGVFRPELLLPMGLPEGVSVLGWGLSLER
uniref:Phenylalanine--tRNA ligase alpha subunit n=1 Tax=Sphenodon punctatus TaxID=8508 RepID=A0A8D0L8W5_SPHPU